MKRFGKGWVRSWYAIALIAWLAGEGIAAGCEEEVGAATSPAAMQSGSLLLAGADGHLAPAPTLETDADLSVRGAIVRARVTQRFINPTDQWLEGVYVFPLPNTAAVDHLVMYVGPRVIEGQIREREAAKRIYEEAKTSGRKASLVEQERPNIFTSSIANVGPNESVEITIEYQDTVPFDGVEFSLRFPLVVAPRYSPGSGSECPDTACTLDAPLEVAGDEPITLPLNVGPPVNPVRLSVELDPGFPLASLYSPSHRIVTQAINPFVQMVSLADVVPADRDFELVWAPARGALPQATLMTEITDDGTYALLSVLPPDLQTAAYRIPRETVFIIDTSGSMAGQSIEQAKMALLIALDKLEPADQFNVIQFNSVTEQLFPHSVPADPDNIDRARDFVGRLFSTGGTEMEPALAAALAEAAAPGEVRQVIFITDGAVSNEESLFRYIQHHLGESRLFTVGIGSAPNAYFMRKAADFGRGTFTFISGPLEVSARMDELFRKLERPVLADIAVDWSGADDEAWPNPLPDLYAGEPLLLAARLHELPAVVTVSGRLGNTPWRVVIHRPPLVEDSGISQLWARRKIESLMDSLAGGADREDVRTDVVAVALQHHLVSQYTSLVAVDVTPTRPDNMTLLTHDVPVNAPHGSALVLPAGATPAPLYALLAIMLFASAIVLRGTVGAGVSPARARNAPFGRGAGGTPASTVR